MRSATCSIWLREMKLKVSGETGAIHNVIYRARPFDASNCDGFATQAIQAVLRWLVRILM